MNGMIENFNNLINIPCMIFAKFSFIFLKYFLLLSKLTLFILSSSVKYLFAYEGSNKSFFSFAFNISWLSSLFSFNLSSRLIS